MSKIRKPVIDAVEEALTGAKVARAVAKDAKPLRGVLSPVTAKPSRVPSNIVWDRQSGIGNVPNQQQLDYFGFERNMKPSEFRQYVPKGVWNKDTKSFLASETSKGKTVAPPFLKVEWDKENKAWRVSNHEGRSRADFSAELNPELDIPISILPIGLRARDITEEMRNAPLFGQEGSPSYINYLKKQK